MTLASQVQMENLGCGEQPTHKLTSLRKQKTKTHQTQLSNKNTNTQTFGYRIFLWIFLYSSDEKRRFESDLSFQECLGNLSSFWWKER